MQAKWGDIVLAEAEDGELVKIEGNWYFPPRSVNFDVLATSPTAYTCPWKGAAQYYSAAAGDRSQADVAWAYPDLRPGAVDRVGQDFAGYLAFDKSAVAIG